MTALIRLANALLAFSFLFTGFVIYESYSGCHRAAGVTGFATQASLSNGCSATVLGTEVKVPLEWRW